MQKQIRAILSKYHLDSYMPEDWEGFTFYDVLVIPYSAMNDLSKDLVGTIRGVDQKDLIIIPSLDEARKLVKHIMSPPDRDDDEYVNNLAQYLISRLKGELYQDRRNRWTYD